MMGQTLERALADQRLDVIMGRAITAKTKSFRDFPECRRASMAVDVPLDAVEDALLVWGQAFAHTY